MSLAHISMAQALDVWSDLCDAYHGKGWGGDTAEIYMYRLMMPERPLVSFARRDGVPLTGFAAKAHAERVDAANEALRALLERFARERTCRIEINGHALDAWERPWGFKHRVHVKVVPQ